MTFDLKVDGLFFLPWSLCSEYFLGVNVTGEHPVHGTFGRPNHVTFCLTVTGHHILMNSTSFFPFCDISLLCHNFLTLWHLVRSFYGSQSDETYVNPPTHGLVCQNKWPRTVVGTFSSQKIKEHLRDSRRKSTTYHIIIVMKAVAGTPDHWTQTLGDPSSLTRILVIFIRWPSMKTRCTFLLKSVIFCGFKKCLKQPYTGNVKERANQNLVSRLLINSL